MWQFDRPAAGALLAVADVAMYTEKVARKQDLDGAVRLRLAPYFEVHSDPIVNEHLVNSVDGI